MVVKPTSTPVPSALRSPRFTPYFWYSAGSIASTRRTSSARAFSQTESIIFLSQLSSTH